MDKNSIKEMVREKYSKIALSETEVNKASCCGATDESKEVYNIMTDDYTELQGYAEDADLGLGCGLPTEFAMIHPGDTVLDLGSGAGNDCFIARHETGPTGRVLGIDFTPAMVKKARENAFKLGYNNVEFREGDIEDMPVIDDSVDVVVSNCVLNLLPDKSTIFKEIYRVLKPSGHFSISDIVLLGELPDSIVRAAEMYAGCVSGAIDKDDYLGLVEEAGFHNVTIQKEKTIVLPDDILGRYLGEEDIQKFRDGTVGIYSITLFASKSEKAREVKMVDLAADCIPGGGCC
ncbi:MAG: arsenite methyltransferase [Saprospiraceae bacterium]|nr:arsenite methyltransferase [Saprospiraceae bacterium]